MPKHETQAPPARPRASAPRWAVWYHQFDLVRRTDRRRYLRRRWLLKTPWGGLALHRMDGPDARDTLHDHPFTFVSIVLRGGYIERRLRPRTMTVDEGHVVRRVNVVRAGVDAHAIRELVRTPTWTLLLVGPHRRAWGFWEMLGGEGGLAWVWRWTKADRFDSGHYVPLDDGTR